MEEDGVSGLNDIKTLVAQCNTAELEAILRTLDSEAGEAAVAAVKAPEVLSTEPVAAPAISEPAAPSTIKVDTTPAPASEPTPAPPPDPAPAPVAEQEAPTIGLMVPPTDARANMTSPAPGDDSGRRAPPPSPVAPKDPWADLSPAVEDPKPMVAPASSSAEGAPKEEAPSEVPPPVEAVVEWPSPDVPTAIEQEVAAVNSTAPTADAPDGPTLEMLLQLMKEQHDSVVAQVQWVASMSMPSTEYLTGVLNQRDNDIAHLQAKLDQLRSEVQTKDDKIANQSVELNECVQSCRHWLVDLEFHKQKLEESHMLGQALEDSNKNLLAEVESASQQVKHANLEVEYGGGISRTPIVTPRGINIGFAGYSGYGSYYGVAGVPMQGSLPWAFRRR